MRSSWQQHSLRVFEVDGVVVPVRDIPGDYVREPDGWRFPMPLYDFLDAARADGFAVVDIEPWSAGELVTLKRLAAAA